MRITPLRVGYGSTVVAELPAREFGPGLHAITGTNGSGKSTLLRVLSGYARALTGRVFVDDEPVDPATLPRHTHYVPDRATLLPRLTIADSFAFVARHRPHRPSASVVDRYVDAFEVRDLLDRFPHHLSRGQKRRCHLALALSAGAAVVLLDEPLTGIDAQRRNAVVDTLVADSDERTFIAATHAPELIGAADTHLSLESR